MKKSVMIVLGIVLLISLVGFGSAQNYTCTDSDGGINYDLRGYINTDVPSWSLNAPDTCSILTAPGSYEDQDSCSGRKCFLVELYCDNEGYPANAPNRAFYNCPNGCKDGACVSSLSEAQTKCIDSDGWEDYYLKGTTTDLSGGNIDICSSDNKTVIEYYCLGDSHSNSTYFCENGCNNGACIKGEIVHQQITCKFRNSSEQQICYTTDYTGGGDTGFSCLGQDSCTVNISGQVGDSSKWISSCSGEVEFWIGVAGEGGPIEFTFYCTSGSNIDEILPSESNETEESGIVTTVLCSGCEFNNLCYPFGYRKSGKYCSDSKQFVNLLESGACDNSFECSSNICVNDECASKNFLQKILDFFRNLFGAE